MKHAVLYENAAGVETIEPVNASGVYRPYIHYYKLAKEYADAPLRKADHLSSIMFSSMLLEAYVNHLGETQFRLWEENREGPVSIIDKLRRLHDKLGLRLPRDSFVYDLVRDRNAMVHSKTSRAGANGAIYISDSNENQDDTIAINFDFNSQTRNLLQKQNPTQQDAKAVLGNVVRLINNLDYAARKKSPGTAPKQGALCQPLLSLEFAPLQV